MTEVQEAAKKTNITVHQESDEDDYESDENGVDEEMVQETLMS